MDSYWNNGIKVINMSASSDGTTDIKLTLDYYAPVSVMTHEYAPGTVSFIVPDIGTLRRSGAAFVPLTVDDQPDSDWDCTYDVESEAYVFTNRKPFLADEPLSGGFEMLWRLNNRECVNDFEMTAQPLFRIENEAVRMSPLTFRCHTDRDFYNIQLERSFLQYEQSLDETLSGSGSPRPDTCLMRSICIQAKSP